VPGIKATMQHHRPSMFPPRTLVKKRPGRHIATAINIRNVNPPSTTTSSLPSSYIVYQRRFCDGAIMEAAVSSPVKEHRRNRSAVLKSMMPVTKSSKRPTADEKSSASLPVGADTRMPFLPPDHPHARQKVLGERPPNNSTAQPRRPALGEERPSKSLHKRTKSAISLRSLGKSKEEQSKEASMTTKSSRRRKESDGDPAPNKKKSSTSLASMFKTKQSKDSEQQEASHSDKENSTPPKRLQPSAQTPIYAAFATQAKEVTSTTKVPLNDRAQRQSIIEEIALYDPDPKRFDESKQRNFFGYDAKMNKAVRPKSEVISNHELGRFLDNPLTRKLSNGRRPQSYIDGDGAGKKAKAVQDKEGSKRSTSRGGAEQISMQKRGTQGEEAAGASRVKAAVARINRRTLKTREDQNVDPMKFNADFDAMLVHPVFNLTMCHALIPRSRKLAISPTSSDSRCAT
jgi:hypothetical protein